MKSWKFIDVIKMVGNSGQNCVQNLFHNTSTLLEQPLLLYIRVTGVCSECNIFVCYLCTGKWCDFTWFDVFQVDFHIVVSVCCPVLVIKPQGMQQHMYNYSMLNACIYAAFQVQLLVL